MALRKISKTYWQIADLAEIYGYSTMRLNEQVKNNIERFDDDFRFQDGEVHVNCHMHRKSTNLLSY